MDKTMVGQHANKLYTTIQLRHLLAGVLAILLLIILSFVRTAFAEEGQVVSSPAVDASSAPENLVAVELACTMSYKATLYDTPSGHLDGGYFVGEASASTTGMMPAHTKGWGYWTVCHDARGHEHEFTLTEQEYAALVIRGTPERSVMESPADAALDAFPPAK
jgi:hypothetical protein